MPDTVGSAKVEIDPTSSERFARLLNTEVTKNLDKIIAKVTEADRKLDQAAQTARDLATALAGINVRIAVDQKSLSNLQTRLSREKFDVSFVVDELSIRKQLERIKFSPRVTVALDDVKDIRVDIHANIQPAMAEIRELSGMNIRLDVEANTAPALAGIEAISGSNVRLDVEANTAPALAEMTTLDKRGEESSHRFSALWTAAGVAAAYGIARIGSEIGRLGLQSASMFEQADIAFTTFLGPAADDFIKKLKDFAATTPFEFKDLSGAASQLLAVGRTATEVIPLMTALGDSTSAIGTGAEGIKSAVRALTQMQQKGKVTGEEMLQLAEAGVPAWDALASKLGVTVVQAQDMVTKGQVKVNSLFEALETKAGPALQRVAGMMDEQSHSLAGLWSTLKDTIGQGLADLFGPIIPVLKDTLPTVANSLKPVFDTLGTVLAPIAKLLADTFTMLAPAFSWLTGAIGSVLNAGLAAIAPILQELAPFVTQAAVVLSGALSDALRDIGPIIATLARDLGPLIPMFAQLAVDLISLVVPILVQLLQALEPLIPVLVAGIGYALMSIKPILPDIAAAFGELVGVVVQLLPALLPLLPPLLRLFDVLIRTDAKIFVAILEGAAVIIEKLIPLVQSASEFVGSFIDALASGNWDDFKKRLSDLWSFITTWVSGTAIPWLQAQIPLWWESFVGWIQESVPIALGHLGEWLAALGGWLVGTALPWLGEKALLLGEALGGWLVDQASKMPERLGALLGIIGEWVSGTAVPWLIEKGGELSSALISWLSDQAAQMPGRLGALISIIGEWVTGTALPFLARKSGELAGSFARWLVDTIRETPGRLMEVARSILSWFTDTAIPWVTDKARELFTSFMSWLVQAIHDLPGNLAGWAKQLFDWLTDLPGKLLEKAGDVGSWLFNLGKDVLQGLLNGITNAMSNIGGFFGGLKDQFVDGFKSSFGISSPSKVMMAIGDQIAAGLVDGVNNGMPALDDAAKRARDALTFGSQAPSLSPVGGRDLGANGPLGSLPPIGSSPVTSPITIGAVTLTLHVPDGTTDPEAFGAAAASSFTRGISEIVQSA